VSDTGIIDWTEVPPLPGRVLSKPELRRSKPDRASFLAQPRNPITVVLDGVSGSYNLGALFRLCDAFLVERLVICGRHERRGAPQPATPLLRKRKLVQAAMGAQRWVPWAEEPDAAAVVRAAKAAGAWIAAVELTVDSVSPAAMQPRLPAVLVLGDERFGISPEVLTYADQTIAIPMLGMANSLNVATAGAIVLHELALRAVPAARIRMPARLPRHQQVTG
jgi:tRNA G18 (ribose-2'-O)-methylase SpoU